jgi:hypothetical protein
VAGLVARRRRKRRRTTDLEAGGLLHDSLGGLARRQRGAGTGRQARQRDRRRGHGRQRNAPFGGPVGRGRLSRCVLAGRTMDRLLVGRVGAG